MSAAIAAAQAAYQAAAERLMEAVRAEYPVGCIVHVTLGRARVTGEVTAHAQWWWSNPAGVSIRNVATEKMRSFDAAHPDIYQPEVVGK